MGRKMNRGKQQVLFNYLPGRTFDFEGGTIARVKSIRGLQNNDLNIEILLQRIAAEARPWPQEFRQALTDRILSDPSRFVLLEPKNVEAELFPKVFWCDNRSCGRVFDYSNSDELPGATCRTCRTGKLVQLRFVKIHRCGELKELSPPFCQRCHTSNYMALDTRRSERISNFRWICRQCGTKRTLFSGSCRACQQWSGENRMQNMSIEVHRAGRTFYAHTTTLLNIPNRQLEGFFNLQEWSAIAAAKFFGLPEVANRSLNDFNQSTSSQEPASDPGLSGADLDELMRRQASGELTAEQMVAQMEALRQQRRQEQQQNSPVAIAQQLEQRTGVSIATWQQAGQEMLEALMPLEIGNPRNLFDQSSSESTVQLAQRMGLSQLALVTDFPMIVATYGYSRVESAPRRNPADPIQCQLNPFPPQRDYGGKFPIYVDQVQADALLLSLNPERVHAWLERNGFQPQNIPNGSDSTLARRSYFVQLFEDAPLRQTLDATRPQARMVFGLLHTLSHLCVRQAALLCGLDQTSLSEYLLPRTLTFAIYCNHRFGATIGALTALFEQSLTEWLNAVRDARRCVYDPVCREREASCHACTHLAETSCRFFNLNLGRSFLFGGYDPKFRQNITGYFDPSLS
ncbi:MAG: DUF1998 domain-containing protein [Coleofasciculus sp. B1-GNL1-01]|uniref:hypothetical protein n=1 Tax=Coleofasciculus sp. B1-GNL1-01 TaxID=3068484 RepID=UPI00330236DA